MKITPLLRYCHYYNLA